MSFSPPPSPPDPQLPARRPYGSVPLPRAVAAPPRPPRTVPPPAGLDGRVWLPLLTVAELRRRPAGSGE
ncbi:hypothetical protein [Actinacidiphila yeochonensis]|uniref:hypothetical protein n=1 Tax=Actinacidiphila yeochonensis TaxID=89050 RepID=UPI0012FEF985|nr:hypothetical protein [Actinacidiphila yeochonensis]